MEARDADVRGDRGRVVERNGIGTCIGRYMC